MLAMLFEVISDAMIFVHRLTGASGACVTYCTVDAVSPTPGAALYASDPSAVDLQKYCQIVAAGAGPSSAVSLAPSVAGGVPAAAAVKPPTGMITPNIHQPPPVLPPYPPPLQVAQWILQVLKTFTHPWLQIVVVIVVVVLVTMM